MSRAKKKKPLTIKQIDEGIRSAGGYLTMTAKKLGVTYNAIYARIQKSSQLQRTLEEIQESYLDLSEYSLMKKIRDEDLGAICFHLKCKGKSRGYIERPPKESHEEKDQIVFNIDLGD